MPIEKPVVFVIENICIELSTVCKNGEHAEKVLLERLSECLSNFDEYTSEDIDKVLEDGGENFGNGRVEILWLTF